MHKRSGKSLRVLHRVKLNIPDGDLPAVKINGGVAAKALVPRQNFAVQADFAACIKRKIKPVKTRKNLLKINTGKRFLGVRVHFRKVHESTSITAATKLGAPKTVKRAVCSASMYS